MQSIVNSSWSTGPLSYTGFMQKVMLVQILVGIFLYVNCLMIFTFLKKVMFREDTRYILFAQTLFVDSAFMVFTDMMLIGNYFQYYIHMIPCIFICSAISILSICSPLTLVAMCLERYVAICMPLRHAEISNSRTRYFGFIIIWGVSTMPPVFFIIAHISVIPSGALFSPVICSMEIMLQKEWQAQSRAAILQLLFIFMSFIIFFTYIKIMIAARTVSLGKKKSTSKSLRTVVLHAVQLFLCVVQFLIPYIEMTFWKADVMVFINVRYSNFIVFIIAPRCLSPLIYGVRDEKFSIILRHYACWGFDHSKCCPLKRK
ncbi:odorant receptor 131-2-like [Pygocentrus nattereri]|uniref:odorant receptor 131-2-like n=1 Tax=Pygocentrus nattereri TaxID=42514 RepID=UPI001891766C|nr:odorant receptor 131-2-like [Pygocentrus nattereri]